MNRLKPPALLLAFFILCNCLLHAPALISDSESSPQPVITFQPSTAYASSPERETIHGRVIYRARGPAIYGIGFTAAMIYGIYGLGGFHHLVPDIEEIVGEIREGRDTTAGDEAATEEFNGEFDEDITLDPADMGILSGYHEVIITFTLEEMPDETWQLQSGTIEWNGSSTGGVSGPSGYYFGMPVALYLYDSFFDFGFEDLDPGTDRINLRIVDDDEFVLDLDVSHPFSISGESEFCYVFSDFLKFRVEADEGNVAVIYRGASQALDFTSEELSVDHFTKGPFNETVVDTFGALFGTQVVVETTIVDTCTPWIVSPDHNEVLTFDAARPGVLTFIAEARTPDNEYHERLEDLVWTFPEIEGSELTTDPEDRRGQSIEVTYTGLPESNTQFGPHRITATFDSDTTCSDPLPRTVRFFFDRDARNNPDGDVPNWFYYWRQTSAGQGLEGVMRYDPRTDIYGYYNPGESVFYICEAAHSRSFLLLSNEPVEGIDTFATTVAHENQHLEDYHEWWPQGYNRSDDDDGDGVPNNVEIALGLDPDIPNSWGISIGKNHLLDVEFTAYWAELTWQIGSANHEDWANPGKQSGGGN